MATVKLPNPRVIDLTGMTFGQLKVLYYAGKQNEKLVWRCQCQCGKVKVIRGTHLKQGVVSSCGGHQYISLEGQKFGRWKVIGFSHRGKDHKIFWTCVCKCGNSRAVDGWILRSGQSKSCGCYHLDRVTTHGMTNSYHWNIWNAMRCRCYNKNHVTYKRYGARGISICKRWRNSFVAFVKDMGPRPTSQHSIDRKDNDGDYTPKNCRWATKKQQANNRSISKRRVTYK